VTLLRLDVERCPRSETEPSTRKVAIVPDEDRGPAAAQPAGNPGQVQEGLTGSGEVRKGADVMFKPPAGPTQGEIPMPVNMAPQAPPATVPPAVSVAGGDGATPAE
jgi:hypothetical protein